MGFCIVLLIFTELMDEEDYFPLIYPFLLGHNQKDWQSLKYPYALAHTHMNKHTATRTILDTLRRFVLDGCFKVSE